MNSQCKILKALVLAFLLILHAWPYGAEAARFLGTKEHSPTASTLPSSSQNAVIDREKIVLQMQGDFFLLLFFCLVQVLFMKHSILFRSFSFFLFKA